METANTAKSGLSTGLAILGLVLGILALLAAFVPLLGSLAFLLGVPAAFVSFIGLLIAQARKAPSGLCIGALLVCLVANGISWWQYSAIREMGQKSQRDIEGMFGKPRATPSAAKALGRSEAYRATPSATPELEPPCRGQFVEIRTQWYTIGTQLLPIESEASRFPRISSKPRWMAGFARMDDELLSGLKIEESIRRDQLRILTKEGCYDGDLSEIKLSQLDGFGELYSALKTMDQYGREDKRAEIVACLKSIQRDWASEIERYTNTPFNVVESIVAKEHDYSLEKKVLALNLSIGGVHIGTLHCLLPLDSARSFFEHGTGPGGKRARIGRVLFSVQPSWKSKRPGGFAVTSVRPLAAPRVIFDGPGGFAIDVDEVAKEFWGRDQDVGYGWGQPEMGGYYKTRAIHITVTEYFDKKESTKGGSEAESHDIPDNN
jgi:hypothetical protein